MAYTNIRYEKREYIGIITICRPEILNAINTDASKELQNCFHQMMDDDDIRCVILTGDGSAFSAGGDIREEADLDVLGAYVFVRNGHSLLNEIELFKAPVIAAINGYAVGGGLELALACDIRIAAEGAKLGLPECTLGVLPGWGGTQRLPRLVGPAKARELIYTGELITAQESLTIGLVNKIAPADQLMTTALAMAEKITKNPPLAVTYSKLAMFQGMQCDQKSGCEIEIGLMCQLYATKDKAEAYAAFLEKRPHAPYIGK